MSDIEGHAFICYVREDAELADRIANLLEHADIPVWRDTENLWPGEDWRQKIREAITEGAFAFIPIFSNTAVAKADSGQNEELYLAAEEMRRRPPGAIWMMPVRFDDCALPKLDLGGGRYLDSIQRTDLFGSESDRQAERLVSAVRRIIGTTGSHPQVVGQPNPASSKGAAMRRDTRDDERKLKSALRDPTGDIRVYDLVIPIVDGIHDELADDAKFPTNAGSVSPLELADQVERYWEALACLLPLLVVGGAWATTEHGRTWKEVIERIAQARGEKSGNVARITLRWFPLLPSLYAGGLAATYHGNFQFLKATSVDASVRDREGKVAAVARVHPFQPFDDLPLTAQVIALRASGEVVDSDVVEALTSGRRGKRHTPVSDHLHEGLRDLLRTFIPDDETYSETFDRFEVLLGLLMTDQRIQAESSDGIPGSGPWIPDAFAGRFTWRDRYAEAEQRIERLLLAELHRDQESWAPLSGGLFGGSVARADAAFDTFLPLAEQARRRRI